MPPAVVCYERLQDDQGLMDHLGRLYREFGLVAAAIVLAERIRMAEGDRAAAEYLLGVLEAKPWLLGLRRATLLLSAVDSEKGRSDMERVSSILSRLVEEIPRYRCRECGFSGSELHWRCPSCQWWASITPV